MVDVHRSGRLQFGSQRFDFDQVAAGEPVIQGNEGIEQVILGKVSIEGIG